MPRGRWRRRPFAPSAVALVAMGQAVFVAAGPLLPVTVYSPSFAGPDRLVTNEYAHYNRDGRAVTSRDWDVTSGSLFARGGHGWTGPPDAVAPDASSANGTGSSVFRATTRRHDFGDVQVSLRIAMNGLISNGRNAAASTDGVHLFLRHRSESELYVVTLNRRDGRLVVKRKLPGGPVNGGTYTTLGEASYPVRLGRWQSFAVRIATVGNTVTIEIRQGQRILLLAVDRGRDGPAIAGAGAIGLRGDNCEFEFDSILVRNLRS